MGQHDLDFLNHSHILNLPQPTTDGEPMRYGDRPKLILHCYRQGAVSEPVKNANIEFNQILTDPYSAYDVATATYTIPENMLILFECACRRTGGSTSWQSVAAKYGGAIRERNLQNGRNNASRVCTCLELAAGTEISVIWTHQGNGPVPFAGSRVDTYFKLVRLG